MAAGRILLLPSMFALLFYLNLLSTFLGKKSTEEHEGLRDGAGSMLHVDGFVSPITADGAEFCSDGFDEEPMFVSTNRAFEPSSLDFREQSVGMPRLETVRLTNPSSTQPLHLNSISGDSPVFHASFFKAKVLKPGEWTTFDVVFLARTVGAIQNTLYIHTSMGTFDYRVQGVSTPNPFRLRSLVGARIPLNATYSPTISMYNPYNNSIQVTEMYSSGGELHLELLSGQSQGAKGLWEIRPYETKPIGRANFFGRTATNHTSFIRIKTNIASNPSLVLPVEVEVSEGGGLFSV